MVEALAPRVGLIAFDKHNNGLVYWCPYYGGKGHDGFSGSLIL